MTNYEKIKQMSIEEMASAIYEGISSNPCDYCKENDNYCNCVPYNHKTDIEIFEQWLESEAES